MNGMYVCVCHAVRESQIIAAAREGAHSVKAMCLATRAGTNCGKCLPEAKRLLEQAVATADKAESAGRAA